jgi:hypothetical protein
MDTCKHSISFVATVVVDNMLVPNVYNVSYSFRVNTADFEQQNIAFNRIKHLFDVRFGNSLILSRRHPKWKTLTKYDNNIVVMPEEPADFTVACAIFRKLQAVVGDRFQILLVQLNSGIGDQVEYFITKDDDDEMEGMLEGLDDKEVWWNDSTPNLNKIQNYVSWSSFGLDWDTPKEKTELPLAKILQFNPKVIEGGKKS